MIISGGGTGLVTLFNGEQLNHTNAEVLYLDFSISSMKIAQKRARIRRLQNIIWVRNWIEGIRYLGLALFEYSQCSGVLHHLKNPLLGLKILKDTLTQQGGMQLMVYARYGRTAVYQVQHLLQLINKNGEGLDTELINANHVLNTLPLSQWFVLNPLMTDHKYGNTGIYDLLLHKRDVAFSVFSLYQWIVKAGIYFVDFDHFATRCRLNIQYVIHNKHLYEKISYLHVLKQWFITEIMRGDIIKHGFFTSKLQESEATLSDHSNILYVYGNPHGFKEALRNKRNQRTFENQQTIFFAWIAQVSRMAKLSESNVIPSNPVIHSRDGVSFAIKLSGFNIFLINKLLDSNKGINLTSACSEYRKSARSNVTNEELFKSAEEFYNSVKHTGLFLLRKQHVSPFPKTAFMTFFQIKSI